MPTDDPDPALDTRPPQQRIADELAARIASGDFPSGARLPSGRALAASHGVALATAQAALKRLADAGLVSVTPRGYTVRGGPGTAPADLAADLVADLAAEVKQLRGQLASTQMALAVQGADLAALQATVDDLVRRLQDDGR